MSDEVIRRALEVAAMTACDKTLERPCSHPSLCDDAGRCLNDAKREECAASIAAFLRALPADLEIDSDWRRDKTEMGALAAAIERAAGGGA